MGFMNNRSLIRAGWQLKTALVCVLVAAKLAAAPAAAAPAPGSVAWAAEDTGFLLRFSIIMSGVSPSAIASNDTLITALATSVATAAGVEPNITSVVKLQYPTMEQVVQSNRNRKMLSTSLPPAGTATATAASSIIAQQLEKHLQSTSRATQLDGLNVNATIADIAVTGLPTLQANQAVAAKLGTAAFQQPLLLALWESGLQVTFVNLLQVKIHKVVLVDTAILAKNGKLNRKDSIGLAIAAAISGVLLVVGVFRGGIKKVVLQYFSFAGGLNRASMAGRQKSNPSSSAAEAGRESGYVGSSMPSEALRKTQFKRWKGRRGSTEGLGLRRSIAKGRGYPSLDMPAITPVQSLMIPTAAAAAGLHNGAPVSGPNAHMPGYFSSSIGGASAFQPFAAGHGPWSDPQQSSTGAAGSAGLAVNNGQKATGSSPGPTRAMFTVFADDSTYHQSAGRPFSNPLPGPGTVWANMVAAAASNVQHQQQSGPAAGSAGSPGTETAAGP